MPKAVFLDRDGTIVEDTSYLHETSKVRFLPRVSRAIKLLKWLVRLSSDGQE